MSFSFNNKIFDNLSWIDPMEHHLYEHLVNIVGSEIDIRKRQRLFIIQDMIYNSSDLTNHIQILSGSLAEGLDLPGSDMDVMYVTKTHKIIHNEKNILNPVDGVTLHVMETDVDYPGFARLRLVAAQNGKSLRERCVRCPTGTCTGTQFYRTKNSFLNYYRRYNKEIFIHGPCLTDKDQAIDKAFCVRCKYLPYNAMPWASRHGRQWPPSFVIDRVVKYGCLLVPIGPKISSDNDTLWRISFSVAERLLVHSFNFTQLLCYGLLKLTLKRIINTNDRVNDLLCSYFLKTALFWVSEEIDININERMTLATAQHVHYVQHSQLIPEELQLEVEHSAMNILPNVMSYCLRFLCYHHLGDIPNKRQALRDLYITVKDNLIRSTNTVSNELTILGVCFEISGDKDMAYQCYEEALQCDAFVCPSAEARKLKLLKI
ncbi:uncharacterized protein [Mytilus edulis]|uniref:uncharacterized protein n=1 Tax=Mytilus edulis TaxID=6550 RepID=UPI0039EEB3EA